MSNTSPRAFIVSTGLRDLVLHPSTSLRYARDERMNGGVAGTVHLRQGDDLMLSAAVNIPPPVAAIDEAAEKAGRLILETYLSPNRTFIDLPDLINEMDPLRDFSEACRRELQSSHAR